MIRRAQDRENVLSLLDDAPFFAAEMRAEWDARGPESFFLVDDGAVLLLRGGFAMLLSLIHILTYPEKITRLNRRRGDEFMNCKIVIPAYEPEERLIDYVKELEAAGLGLPIVVDDGSGSRWTDLFSRLRQMGCEVLTHPENRGKGAALKTAFRHILETDAEVPGRCV